MGDTDNYLIGTLKRKDRMRLVGRSVRVALTKAAVLQQSGEVTSHVYFPLEGSIALLNETSGCAALEVGMIGSEGMAGAHLALGSRAAPQRQIVQTPGWAIRIEPEPFRDALVNSPQLQQLIHRYLYLQLTQQAGMIACIHFHRIAPRLASWLLRCQDRAHSCSFPVTQAFMASMLGVRRVSITNVAGCMQDEGLIRYHRGSFEVLDRAGLEALACVCYAKERIAYDSLLA